MKNRDVKPENVAHGDVLQAAAEHARTLFDNGQDMVLREGRVPPPGGARHERRKRAAIARRR